MNASGRIEFVVLAVLGIATMVALAVKGKNRNRDVAWWYLMLATWVGLLIDALFLMAALGFRLASWGPALFLLLVGVRILIQGWLLWLVLRKRRSP